MEMSLTDLDLAALKSCLSPGSKAWIKVNVGLGLEEGETPLMLGIAMGVQPGPWVYLGGGAHGDELGGVEVVSRVFGTLDAACLHGGLLAVPLQDPVAIRQSAWTSGRTAFGSGSGPIFEALSRIASECSAVVDLHCPSFFNQYLPTAYVADSANLAETLNLARDLGTAFAVLTRGQGLTYGVAREGVPALIFEFGEGGRRDAASADWVVSKVTECIRNAGRVSALASAERKSRLDSCQPLVIREQVPILAPVAGYPQFHVSLGAEVRQGDVLVTLHGLMGTGRPVTAPTGSWVLSTSTKPYFSLGDRLVLLGKGR